MIDGCVGVGAVHTPHTVHGAVEQCTAGMIGAPKVGPARLKIVSAQPSPLAQPIPPGWAGLDIRKPSLDEAK